ncbi:MAG: hypothetical protein ACOY93_23365 [Bacillota bacterium]
MRRGAVFGAGVLLVLLLGLWLWPIGGVIWRAGQVERLALIREERRREFDAPVVVREVLQTARLDRFRYLLLRPVGLADCRPQEVALLTRSGWVDLQIRCPGGLFLDYLPRP